MLGVVGIESIFFLSRNALTAPPIAATKVNKSNVEVKNAGFNGLKFHGKEIIPRENPNVEREKPRFSVRGQNGTTSSYLFYFFFVI